MGGIGISELNTPYDFAEDYATNLENGAIPSDRLLAWSRFPMEILAAISILFGFILLNGIAGRIPGIYLGRIVFN